MTVDGRVLGEREEETLSACASESRQTTGRSDAMGSSGQQRQPYRDNTDNAFTEGWENSTQQHVSAGKHWLHGESRDSGRAIRELRWMWELHVYAIASLFTVLALLCLFTVLRLRAQLSQSRNVTSLNVFLGILATARLLVLFMDPYGSKKILPLVMLQVLWDLGYPCLVSAFALLQLAVARETEARVAVPGRLSESTASIVITFHFCLIITSGVLGAVQKWLRVVWLVTQVVFIVWGGFLFLSTLFGCLRVLRSVKVPLRFLTQVDPGCEVNSIVPHGMFTEQQGQHPRQHEKQHHPRIHITDVDDQTYSYASEGSLAIHSELTRSESLPMRCLSISPTRVRPPDRVRSKPSSPIHEDPATIKPLIDRPRRYTISEKLGNPTRGPATIFGFETRSPTKHSLPPSLMPSIFAEDIRKDARRLKHPVRSRFEKHLRHLVFTATLGVALCLLRAYDVLGHDGLIMSNTKHLLPWFFFQTTSRFVELVMAYAMVCGSQKSSNNRFYYYRN